MNFVGLIVFYCNEYEKYSFRWGSIVFLCINRSFYVDICEFIKFYVILKEYVFFMFFLIISVKKHERPMAGHYLMFF